MQLFTYRSTLAAVMVCLLTCSSLGGQVPEDCEGAIIICSDDIINFNPNGIGKDDFANPNNDEGCLEAREKEGIWFYFSFRTDMPTNSEIEFTITPIGQNNEDYDFAIYGPDLICDSLGSPLRCSFFDQVCYRGIYKTPYRCPETGLGRGATDFSESKFYADSEDDGFVAPIVVQPGEGFYMFLDNFGTTARAFELEWGGSAAPFLNCLADPVCNSKKVDAGPDEQLCFDETTLFLQTTLTNTTPEAMISWSAEPAIATTFLDDSTAREPIANIPTSFSGEIIYTMTMIDEGCEKIDRKRVLVNRPDVTITGQTPFCSGDPNVLSIPEGYSSYFWSTGETTNAISVGDPGLYWVEIVDNLGCTARGELQVEAFAPLLFEVEGPDTVCLNEVANLRCSPGFMHYLWSTTETTQNIFASGTGMYQVTATDNNGCTYTDSLFLNEWDPPEPSFLGVDSFCTGLNGTIIANAGFVAYDWSTGETTQAITVSEGGVYRVTVTDTKACEGEGVFEITKTLLPRPIIDGTLNICSGASTDLSVDPNFRDIFWSTGETTPAITRNSGGMVSVMVVDNLGCQGFDTVSVTQNALPELLEQGISGYCEGGSVVLDPGQEFVKYIWSTGETTPTITVSRFDIYRLTVTDANGCEAEGELDVVEYANPTFTLSDDFTFCQNDSVQISVNQNFPGYNWSDGREGKSLFFAQAGDYTVMVIDDNGCSSSLDFKVTSDTLPTVSIGGDPAICPGGIANISGQAGYEGYLWSTGVKTQDITIDTAGLYTLSVTDVKGCIGQDSVLIIENPVPDPKISGLLGICPGDTTQVRVIGGYQSYRWSNGDMDAQALFFQPGNYSVSVTDNLGCEGSAPVTISTFLPPDPVIAGKDAFCEGYTSVLQVKGDYASYEWSTGDDRYLTIINKADLYSVTVTDVNGCQGVDTKQVKVNPRPVLNLMGEPEFCQGGQTIIDAGPGFVDYIWSTGNRTQMAVITEPGYFSLVVRDTNNCLIAKGMIIEENPLPEPAIMGDSIICEVGGSTTLMVDKAHDGYIWSDGKTTRTNKVIQAGLYSVTVTDGNNCQGETSFEVIHQINPDPEIIGALGFCEGANTEISVDPIYTSYLWSTGETVNSVLIDSSDTYSVTVTDALGCMGMEVFSVEEYNLPVINLDAMIDICPDIVVSIDAGEEFSSYLWSTGETTRFLQTDRAGDYALTVTDINGCIDSIKTTLIPLEKPVIVLPEDIIVCPEETVQIEADSGFVNYRWSDGTQGQILIASDPADYVLTAEDLNGCEASDTIRLIAFPTQTPDIVGPDTLCAEENSLLSISQNFADYRWEYNLNNGMALTDTTSAQLRIKGGGKFMVIVIDVNGCETRDTMNVAEIALPQFDFVGDKSLCEGVEANVGVRPAFASYRWSNGATDSSTVFFDPKTYSVTVEDEYGCAASKSITVEEKDAPNADPGLDLEFPCTDSTIQIGGTLSSTGSSIRHNWVGPGITVDNYNVPNPVVAEPGEYFYLVRDTSTGCQSPIGRVHVFSGAGEYEVNLVVGDNIDCETQTVELDASRSEKADSLFFQWLDSSKTPIDGATASTVGVHVTGWYYLETILLDTRCARVDSIQLNPDFLAPRAFAGHDQTLTCDQQSITLDAGASSRGVGIVYDWRLVDGNSTLIGQNQQLEINKPGRYALIVTNLNNGCSDVDTLQISLDQQIPRATLAGDLALDCLSPTGTLDGSASQTGDHILYRWLEELSGRQLGERSNQLRVNQEGSYMLIVKNENNGCVDTAFASVIDNIDLPEIVDINFGASACFNNQDGFISIDKVIGGTGSYVYSFNGGSTFGTANSRKQLLGGVYHIVVEDDAGCQTAQKIELAKGNAIEIDLGGDQVIQLGDQVQVDARVRSGKPVATFQWLEPDTFLQETSRTLIDIPYKDRTFIATATDVDGCIAIDTAFVKVLINRDVYIPNIFRPDDAEEVNNSRFTVFASSQVEEIKRLSVFDRWGEAVFNLENFKPNDPSVGWDGYLRGTKAHRGVYVYYCEVIFKDGEKIILMGDVILIR